MSKQSSVLRWAAILHWVTVVAMAVLPIALVAIVATTPLTPAALNLALQDVAIPESAGRAQIFTVFALGLLSPLVLWLTLNQMRQLFAHYAEGMILTPTNARLIHRTGAGFVALAIVPFVLHPLQTLILSLNNPVGERSIAVSLETNMMFFAISGGLIMMIGWAMGEASEVAAENRAFV